MKGTRLSAEVRERGGPAVANEIALDGISCFGVPLKKSEGERERERERIIEALFTAALLVLHSCFKKTDSNQKSVCVDTMWYSDMQY